MRQLILTIISCSYLFADKPITAENILNLEYISQPSINVGTRIAYVKSCSTIISVKEKFIS